MKQSLVGIVNLSILENNISLYLFAAILFSSRLKNFYFDICYYREQNWFLYIDIQSKIISYTHLSVLTFFFVDSFSFLFRELHFLRIKTVFFIFLVLILFNLILCVCLIAPWNIKKNIEYKKQEQTSFSVLISIQFFTIVWYSV